MRLKTVLNRVHKVKGFVYQQARFLDSASSIRPCRCRIAVIVLADGTP